jgi:hypothetical protein
VGQLQVGAKPFAKVSIDEREIGTTPIAAQSLSPGPHTVVFVHPDYQPFRRRVVITAGATARLTVDWALDGIKK